MSSNELNSIVHDCAGRSAVNMERLISTAVQRAGCLSVMARHFEEAMLEEPSDFDPVVAKKNADYNKKFGWRGNVILCSTLFCVSCLLMLCVCAGGLGF